MDQVDCCDGRGVQTSIEVMWSEGFPAAYCSRHLYTSDKEEPGVSKPGIRGYTRPGEKRCRRSEMDRLDNYYHNQGRVNREISRKKIVSLTKALGHCQRALKSEEKI
ncbi:hypothetical protein PoB_002510500 [Plakobranchus ocellatus]|uniref:BHLH domain-containing protein n=1 Tax=Plakobranchus ocellatus TaxID=259542 RepID=A0AAV3ZS47_9GAST|nr:hypothetical protein PoB_002510500 [Plakobranchus ocellatus]